MDKWRTPQIRGKGISRGPHGFSKMKNQGGTSRGPPSKTDDDVSGIENFTTGFTVTFRSISWILAKWGSWIVGLILDN